MKTLDFEQVKELLRKYKIPFAEARICQTSKEAISFAQEIGYPLVLKIVSPDVLHKTDIGGVKFGIENERDLQRGFNEIISSARAIKTSINIKGVLVQKMVSGKEIIIGMKRDKIFGPVLIFGLGGIFVEILKDVSLRIAPVNQKQAEKMIKEIKGFPILKGARDQEPVNITKIAEIITNLSQLCLEQEKIQEIDLNPVIVNQKQALIVDARFLI
jgi:acetyl-CoA synthetase (ADP-forming)